MSPASQAQSRLGVEDGDHPQGVAEQPGRQHANAIRPLKLPR